MQGVRLLIVDDRIQVRQELRSLLPLAGEIYGLPVEIVGEARDGQEAVEQARSLQPAVILMDLEMPRLNGFEATRILKTMQPAPRVVAFTINNPTQVGDRAIEAGVDRLVEKGSPIRDILQAIHST